MKVKMITTAAGPGGTFLAGQEVDVAPELGAAWVAGGFAVSIDAEPVPAAQAEQSETATAEPPEAAVAPVSPRRPRRR